MRALFARPLGTGRAERGDENSLKYDLYLSRQESGLAWGAALNDRWEGLRLDSDVASLASELGADIGSLWALRAALTNVSHALTVSFGFDSVDQPPRVKGYLQEDRWGEGLGSRRELDGILGELLPGCDLPSWLPESRRIGVITWVARPDGSSGFKAYLGGESAIAAAAGAPQAVLSQARRMQELCPLRRSWWYLTIRCEADRSPRYAINKIYNHVQVGFGAPELLGRAWSEVGGLFRAVGGEALLEEVRKGADPDLRLVPTATAWEVGRSATDVYCGSWCLRDP